MRKPLLVAALVLAVLAVACSGRGSGDGATSTPSADEPNVPAMSASAGGATPTPACREIIPGAGCAPQAAPQPDHPAGVSRSSDVSLGATIDSSQATAKLEMVQGDEHVQPVGAIGSRILVERTPRDARVVRAPVFQLWDPVAGQVVSGWEGIAGSQDMIAGTSGDWVLVVRTGFSLPFPVWQLFLRNAVTAEQIPIAQNDPNVATVAGLPLRLPVGFAPTAAISGSLVVWPEFVLDASGNPRERLELYDLSTRQSRMLVDIDPRKEDVWGPTVADGIVAWAHREDPSAAEDLVVLHLDGGQSADFPVGGDIYRSGLSGDGRYLAWDDGYKAKYAIDLQSGQRVQYAGDEGWGTIVSSHYVSWTPSTNPGGYGGYYDFNSKQVRFLPRLPENIQVNVATVMGGWFIWQELHGNIDPNKLGPPDISGSYFYFLRLPP